MGPSCILTFTLATAKNGKWLSTTCSDDLYSDVWSYRTLYMDFRFNDAMGIASIKVQDNSFCGPLPDVLPQITLLDFRGNMWDDIGVATY